MKRKSRLQTFKDGSENYSSKKSVLIRVRWFESIPVHHKEVVLKLSLFFIKKGIIKMIDITNSKLYVRLTLILLLYNKIEKF